MRRALKFNAKLVLGWSELAKLQIGSQRLDDAAKSVAKVVALRPGSGMSLDLMGKLAMVRGDASTAVDRLNRSMDVKANFRTAYHLGLARIATGDSEGAIAAYRRSIALNPNFAQAQSNLGHMLERAGNLKQAEKHLRRAIALAPKLSNPNQVLWRLLKTERRTVELRAHSLDWRSRIPGDSMAWGNSAYATLYYGEGSRRENALAAIPHAEKGLELSEGKEPPIFHALGVAQFEAGQLEASEKTLRQGLELAINLQSPRDSVQRVLRSALKRTIDERARR